MTLHNEEEHTALLLLETANGIRFINCQARLELEGPP